MFPYKDENPTFHPTIVTWALVGLNVAVWVFVQGMGSEPMLTRSVCQLGLIPGELLGRVAEGSQIRLGPTAICQLGAVDPIAICLRIRAAKPRLFQFHEV